VLLRRLAELEHANGQVVDERLAAVEATAAKISLRTGCFCNPGAGEGTFGLDISALKPLRGPTPWTITCASSACPPPA
jgi:hypothetical protein